MPVTSLLTTTFHCKTFQLPEMAFNNFLFQAILFQHDTIRRFFYNLTTGHHCPPLASDQQRLSQPFLFDLDVRIFLKFRELFLKNGMVARFQVKEKTAVFDLQKP
jgi:hypothetical protein